MVDLELIRDVPLEAWTKPDIIHLIDMIEQLSNMVDELTKEVKSLKQKN